MVGRYCTVSLSNARKLPLVIVVTFILVASGCISDTGTEEEDQGEDSSNEVHNVDHDGCANQNTNGELLPEEDLSLNMRVDWPPERVLARFSSDSFVGVADLVLETENETLWEQEVTAVGEYGGVEFNNNGTFEAGSYTFTASTETGAGTGRLVLRLETGGGCD